MSNCNHEPEVKGATTKYYDEEDVTVIEAWARCTKDDCEARFEIAADMAQVK
jgi:hypothetical protein